MFRHGLLLLVSVAAFGVAAPASAERISALAVDLGAMDLATLIDEASPDDMAGIIAQHQDYLTQLAPLDEKRIREAARLKPPVRVPAFLLNLAPFSLGSLFFIQDYVAGFWGLFGQLGGLTALVSGAIINANELDAQGGDPLNLSDPNAFIGGSALMVGGAILFGLAYITNLITPWTFAGRKVLLLNQFWAGNAEAIVNRQVSMNFGPHLNVRPQSMTTIAGTTVGASLDMGINARF